MCQPAWRRSTRHREQWEQMKRPNQNYRLLKTRNYPKENMGKPELHSGRAERAGGRSCHILSIIGIPIPFRHGRTSRSVAHGNPSISCNIPYRIRRAGATVGLPDGAGTNPEKPLEADCPEPVFGSWNLYFHESKKG